MSTNYYLHKKVEFPRVVSSAEEVAELAKSLERIHIGKQSFGWRFIAECNEHHYASDQESFYNFLSQEGVEIIDEYGRVVSSAELIASIKSRVTDKANSGEDIIHCEDFEFAQYEFS